MGWLYSQLFIKPKCPDTSFAGQTVIVTGSNTGLGREAACHFTRLGASKVILAVRNTEAGEAAKGYIESATHCAPKTIEVWPLDLGSFESVKAFAQRAARDLDRIDILCENAGRYPFRKTVYEGYEATLIVNVISTILLGVLLLPKLKETSLKLNKETYLNIVSSDLHEAAKFPEAKAANIIDSVNKNENLSERYAVTKLMEILVVRHIAPKLEGTGVIVNTLTPGLCHSDLAREGPRLPIWIVKFLLARPTKMGGGMLVASAVAGKESHGKYMENGVISEHALSKFVRSEDGNKAGEKLWKELSVIFEEIQPGATKNI